MPSEFDIIREYFNQPGLGAVPGEIVRLGIGDDCALLSVPEDMELALSMDTLVEKIHFPEDAPPGLLAWRALCVNLSDLAAMGAKPAGFTLSLSLPDANAEWLKLFSAGLKTCAEKYGCPLIGGDTSRGPLVITIQVHGLIPSGMALVRSGAKSGDRLYVSGSLGSASLALKMLSGEIEFAAEDTAVVTDAFYKPVPRLNLGMAARGFASAGIDISDGLLADLGHICQQSTVGAEIHLPSIPVESLLRRSLEENESLALALTGGDDYELILVVPESNIPGLEALAKDVPLTCIGKITADTGIKCLDKEAKLQSFADTGFQHF